MLTTTAVLFGSAFVTWIWSRVPHRVRLDFIVAFDYFKDAIDPEDPSSGTLSHPRCIRPVSVGCAVHH